MANILDRLKSFLREVRSELKKVSWPSRQDLYKTTLAVIISTVVFGIYLFSVDFVFAKGIKELIKLLK